MSDLKDSVERALADGAEGYDIDVIAQSLRQRGAQSVDDVPAEEFWALVEEHAPPDLEEVTELDRFKDEVEQAAKTPPGTPAVWQRGGIALEITGFSRVNMEMPQPLASCQLTVAGGEPEQLTTEETSSWSRLWETVETRLDAWAKDVQERRTVGALRPLRPVVVDLRTSRPAGTDVVRRPVGRRHPSQPGSVTLQPGTSVGLPLRL